MMVKSMKMEENSKYKIFLQIIDKFKYIKIKFLITLKIFKKIY